MNWSSKDRKFGRIRYVKIDSIKLNLLWFFMSIWVFCFIYVFVLMNAWSTEVYLWSIVEGMYMYILLWNQDLLYYYRCSRPLNMTRNSESKKWKADCFSRIILRFYMKSIRSFILWTRNSEPDLKGRRRI